MKNILTYGTFDLFHVGHVNLLKRIKELGGNVYVGVSTDKFNELKGKHSFYSYEERAAILESCKYVDKVFPEESWSQKVKDIKNFNVDVFVIGDDWAGHFDELNEYCEVCYLPRTENISTTEIKAKLMTLKKTEIDEIKSSLTNALDVVSALIDS